MKSLIKDAMIKKNQVWCCQAGAFRVGCGVDAVSGADASIGTPGGTCPLRAKRAGDVRQPVGRAAALLVSGSVFPVVLLGCCCWWAQVSNA